MSADEHLHPAQFLHGTSAELNPGDMIDPRYSGRVEGSDRVPLGTTYFTTDRRAARHYANQAMDRTVGRKDMGERMPRVYHVEPTGPHEYDPDDGGFLADHGAERSRHPLVVKSLVEQQERGTGLHSAPWHAPEHDFDDVLMSRVPTHPEGNRDRFGDLLQPGQNW